MASAVEDFTEIVNQRTGKLAWPRLKPLEQPEGDSQFQRERERLVELLLLLYSFAAMLAKRVDTLEEAAQVWDVMASACDDCLEKLNGVDRTDDVRDQILDIKNECMELRDLHA